MINDSINFPSLTIHLAWRGPNRRPWQPQIAFRGGLKLVLQLCQFTVSEEAHAHQEFLHARGQGLGDAVGNNKEEPLCCSSDLSLPVFPTKKLGNPPTHGKKHMKQLLSPNENTAFLLPTSQPKRLPGNPRSRCRLNPQFRPPFGNPQLRIVLWEWLWGWLCPALPLLWHKKKKTSARLFLIQLNLGG